jgi:flagellar operon protein
MDSGQVGLTSPLDTRPTQVTSSVSATDPTSNVDFRQLVQSSQNNLSTSTSNASNITISAHARERLRMRNITLNDDDMAKISNAMDKVAEKGGREALFLVNTSSGQNAAMVVSVRNRVVITAVDSVSMRDNIFTNIDSAAIVS